MAFASFGQIVAGFELLEDFDSLHWLAQPHKKRSVKQSLDHLVVGRASTEVGEVGEVEQEVHGIRTLDCFKFRPRSIARPAGNLRVKLTENFTSIVCLP